MDFQASYLNIHAASELTKRRDRALALLAECRLCPRGCTINRLENERGFCQTGSLAMVSSYQAHFGEEQPLVGVVGSGTIFFANLI